MPKKPIPQDVLNVLTDLYNECATPPFPPHIASLAQRSISDLRYSDAKILFRMAAVIERADGS